MVRIERSTVACRLMRHHRWSQVPPEILDLVLQRLHHPDCLNFGKVCASWRSVFLDRRGLSLPPPSLLQIPFHGQTSQRYFWCVHGDHLMKLFSPVPDLPPDLLNAQRVVGSSMGWLVINSTRMFSSEMYLLNPITNQQIPLPSLVFGGLPLYPDVDWDRCFLVIRVNLSSPPTTGDCVLLARIKSGGDRFLAQCSPGDQKWAICKLQPHQTRLIKDSCDSVFHNGELYILHLNGDLLLCTYDSQLEITILVSVVTLCGGENPRFKRLVISDGEVLLVVRRLCGAIAMDGSPIPPVWWVFKNSKEQGGWARVESLGSRVLLIGLNGAESLNTNDLMGSSYEPNCIYYQTNSESLQKYNMANKINHNISFPGNCPGPVIEWIVAQSW